MPQRNSGCASPVNAAGHRAAIRLSSARQKRDKSALSSLASLHRNGWRARRIPCVPGLRKS